MVGPLAGKVVVITGGSRGIGRAIAMAFAHDGAQTVIGASSAENLSAASRAITEVGPEPLAITGDLRRLDGCEQVLARVKERFGRCDILINNAGATRRGKFMELTDDAFLDGFQIFRRGAAHAIVLADVEIGTGPRDQYRWLYRMLAGAGVPAAAHGMTGTHWAVWRNLANKRVISANAANAIENLRKARNALVHIPERQVTPSEAIEFVGQAGVLSDYLQTLKEKAPLQRG